MSEQYPTEAEYQEHLNEIFAQDAELYNYIMYCEIEVSAEFHLDDFEERLYLMDEIDLVTAFGVMSAELGDLRNTNLHGHESREEAYKKRFLC